MNFTKEQIEAMRQEWRAEAYRQWWIEHYKNYPPKTSWQKMEMKERTERP